MRQLEIQTMRAEQNSCVGGGSANNEEALQRIEEQVRGTPAA